jgi:hypothetical protein
MPQVYFQSTGVEELLEDIEAVLMRDINQALDTVYQRREPSDVLRAQRRGVPYEAIKYDYVPPSHFHIGNFPSLVLEEVPPEAYPYIVITIEDYTPDQEDARSDHVNVYRQTLATHALAKALPEEGSDIVFRRAVRMGEAIYISLASDPHMQKLLSGLSNPVRGQHSIPWTYQHEGHGDKFWFQAVGTNYAIKSHTTSYQ